MKGYPTHPPNSGQTRTLFHQTLLVFVVAQHGRTPSAGAELNERTDALYKASLHAMQEYGKFTELRPEDFRYGYDRPETEMFLRKLHEFEFALDLACGLVLNDAEVEFVLSDLGVTSFNQWRQGGGQACSELSDTGVQLFLPISPRCMLVFYDSDIYDIRAGRTRVVTLRRNQDVRALNSLAIEDAYQNVYFTGHRRTAQQVTGAFQRTMPRHKSPTHARFDAPMNGSLLIPYRKPLPVELPDTVFIVKKKWPKSYRVAQPLVRAWPTIVYERRQKEFDEMKGKAGKT